MQLRVLGEGVALAARLRELRKVGWTGGRLDAGRPQQTGSFGSAIVR